MEKETLHRYFKGQATEAEERQVLDWVDASAENRSVYLQERMLFDVALLHPVAHKKQKRLTPVMRWVAGIAASVVVLIAVAHMAHEYATPHDHEAQTITVPAGQRAHLTLADGTKVWLNAGTTLTFPATFGRASRDVQLDGEAYFEVKGNPQRPFNVYTENNRIEVTGTAFNVSAYGGTAFFKTFLLTGIVDVHFLHADEASVRLKQNEVLESYQGKKTKKKSDADEQIKWKDGLYCFDDTAFELFLEKLEIYYDVVFVVENEEVLNYQVTGKFREQDGVEHVLKTIQRDHEFVYDIKANSDTIRIRKE